jgi:formylglycine-generating enzyme required for sulfatase activity
MGARDGQMHEQRAHLVHIGAFCIDATEVTVGSYLACVAARRCPPLGTEERIVSAFHLPPQDQAEINAFCNGAHRDRGSYPANCVSWNDAAEYCSWLNKSLPTEEQWEYAARGTDGRRYPWGDLDPRYGFLNACVVGGVLNRGDGQDREIAVTTSVCEHLTEQGAAERGSDPVARYPAGRSPFGLWDMAGNVAEWTGSHYVGKVDENATDVPSGADGMVIRGGGWLAQNDWEIRTTFRGALAPAGSAVDVGFRCAQ